MAHSALAPYQNLDQNPNHLLNLADKNNSDDDSSDSDSSSSSSDNGTLTAAADTTTDKQQDVNDNNSNQTVNTYPTSILRSPKPAKIPIDTAIKRCQHRTTKKVTFSSTPPTFIPYPYLITKHITTSVQFSECLVIDSGCNAHMRNNKSMFDYITPVTDTMGHPLLVQQGDGSYLNIKGYGQVTEKIDNHTDTIDTI